jgi:hypothetical protein
MKGIMGVSRLSNIKIAGLARSVRHRTDKCELIVFPRSVAQIEPDQVATALLWQSASHAQDRR